VECGVAVLAMFDLRRNSLRVSSTQQHGRLAKELVSGYFYTLLRIHPEPFRRDKTSMLRIVKVMDPSQPTPLSQHFLRNGYVVEGSFM
jgi:hypothetical protein